MKKSSTKPAGNKLDKKLTDKIVKDLEAQYPGGFARKLLNNVIDQAVLGAIKKQEEAKQAVPKKAAPKLMDADLVNSMEKRLSNLENLSRSQRAEIKLKTEQLEKAKIELEKLKKEVPVDKHTKFQAATKANENIKKENNEMKAFMKEYGYNWDDKSGSLNFEEIKGNLDVKGPSFRNDLPKEIDLGIIIRRISELNTIAEIDAKKLVKSKGVHSLGIHRPLEIIFYKNGIMLDGYPFHSYRSKEAQGMLSDILDGYFPYDLKEKYPEGVPLKVIDKITEKYDSLPKPIPETQPKSVNVVLQQGTVEVDTVVKRMEKEGKSFEQTELVTLRVRTENGKLYVLLKLLAADTMKSVYEYVKPYR